MLRDAIRRGMSNERHDDESDRKGSFPSSLDGRRRIAQERVQERVPTT